MNFNGQDRSGAVTLSAAKGLVRWAAGRPQGSPLHVGHVGAGLAPDHFATLSMTLLVLLVKVHSCTRIEKA